MNNEPGTQTASQPSVARQWGRAVEEASAGNLKQTWVEEAAAQNWAGPEGQGRLFLAGATQIKNVWIPYGE